MYTYLNAKQNKKGEVNEKKKINKNETQQSNNVEGGYD